MVDIYVRVGKGKNGYKAWAGIKPSPAALEETREGRSVPIPTVQVRLKLDLSPTAFDAAEIEIPIDDEALQAAMLSASVA